MVFRVDRRSSSVVFVLYLGEAFDERRARVVVLVINEARTWSLGQCLDVVRRRSLLMTEACRGSGIDQFLERSSSESS